MTTNRHLPIIELLENTDNLIERGLSRMKNKGGKISCQKGCAHCCHLLVEVTWEEAENLAFWLLQQPSPVRSRIRRRIRTAASERKRFFKASGSGSFLAQPTRCDKDTPDETAHEYFYGETKRPCPFLKDSTCQAYSARPTACRLHLVTTPPELCSRSAKYSDPIRIPREADQARTKVVSLLDNQDVDGRWGEMAILVDAVLDKLARDLGSESDSERPKAA